MPLPSSGQITFDNVRIETSQSAMTSYAFGGWVQGAADYNQASTQRYAPINVLSSGSRFSTSATYSAPYEMSDWYSYNHTASIPSSVTGTLYHHFNEYSCDIAQSMLLIDAGTSNTTWSINISGSTVGYLDVYYGRPWNNTGTIGSTGSSTFITGGILNPNMSFNYNYTYDANKGQYLCFVIASTCA